MNDETLKLIDKLKAIRLELFRNTANLDDTITALERAVNGRWVDSYTTSYVNGVVDSRRVVKEYSGWDSLDAQESFAFAQLLESLK